jgi:ferredoxin
VTGASRYAEPSGRPEFGEGEVTTVKVVVDYDACASNAVCMGLLPQVFEVRDDGFLYILEEHPAESLREELEVAVQSCPTGAISIVDDE